MIEKRGQAWGFDVMIAAAVFVSGLLAFYFFAINYGAGLKQDIEQLRYDADSIADNLLSEGFPADWNETTLTKIGITTSNQINETKLEKLYNMSIINYESTKIKLNTRYDYFINFSIPITIQGNVEGIGHYPLNSTNIVQASRFTIYKDKPVTLYVILWE